MNSSIDFVSPDFLIKISSCRKPKQFTEKEVVNCTIAAINDTSI